ncbi:MAG: anti-sigma factor [Cyanobacteria bacterium J06648_16]
MNESNLSDSLSNDEKMLAAGYVLGDLTAEESLKLDQLAAENPDIWREIHALQASYALLPAALSVVPSPEHLRDTIAQPSAAQRASIRRPNSQPAAVAALTRRWLPMTIVGLATLTILALAADNFRLRYRLAQEAMPEQVASILQQPNSRLIALTDDSSDAAGTLLFTPGNWQEVVVSLGDLPPQPPDQVYRMWLALENGDVIYCGEFNTRADGSVFIRFTPPETPPKGTKATEIFVTIDASNGIPNHSGERVIAGSI